MLSILQGMLGEAAKWLQQSSIEEAPDASTPAPRPGPPYEPTFADVLVVKAMMSKGCGLPNELMDKIVDLAAYWPHTTTQSTGDSPRFDNSAPWWKAIRAGRPKSENEFLVSQANLALSTALTGEASIYSPGIPSATQEGQGKVCVNGHQGSTPSA